MPEQQIYQANSAIASGSGSTMVSTFSIVATGDGTVICYDHWEDGYETDLSDPKQSTTRIWGDGNDAHGIPPGFVHNPVGLPAGTVITLTNSVALPRNPSTVLWDARDHVAATKALVISRAAWPAAQGPVFAGAVGVLSTLDYGLNYVSPVGQDMSNGLFKYVGMFVMAAQNNTVLTVDRNGNGVGVTNVVLNQGESYLVNGGIRKGGRVTASKPVQADLLVGHVGASYASDWFTLYPVESWDNSYYTPVGTSSSGNPTYVYLFNPDTNAISIHYSTKIGSGVVTVPGTNGVYQFTMPTKSGAHFSGADERKFFAICTVAANPASDTAYNWGFTLVPNDALTTEATVGWGPGSANGTVNGSPVWVTTVANTRVYVDYKGDRDGPLTDPNGNHYDIEYSLATLQSQTIYDPSRNQTGMRVYTVDGTLLTAAWGEDPDVAAPGNPYIDAGTTVLPFPVPVLRKAAAVIADIGAPGLSIGDTLEYTVQVDNKGLAPLGNIVVIDAPSGNLGYVPNSTILDGGSVADSATGSAFPLDAPGYLIPVIQRGGTTTFKYRCSVLTSGIVSNSVNIGGSSIMTMMSLSPPPAAGALCSLTFSDSNGVPVSLYAVGAEVFVTMTNAAGNAFSNTIQTISVAIQNVTRGDVETIALSETGPNSGVFVNASGLLTSASSGLGQQDGTMNVLGGDALSVAYTDPNFGNSANASAMVQIPSLTKVLYLSAEVNTNTLSRLDPVASVRTNTALSAVLGNSGSNSVIAIDTTSRGGNAGAASLTIPHTTSAETNRLMLVGVAIGRSGSLTSVSGATYAGRSLNFLGQANDGSNVRCEIWGLTNPPSGAANVVINLAASRPVVAAVTTFSGVDQTTPVGSFAGTWNSSANKVATIVSGSAPDELVYSAMGVDGDNSRPASALDLVPAAGQTGLATNKTGGNYIAGGCSVKSGAASVTNSWSWTSSSQQWAMGAISIKPAFVGGSGGNTSVSFTQTPAFAQNFELLSGNPISITNFIAVTSGSMPASPAITATLKHNGTNILTLSNPAYTADASTLVWNGVLGGNIAIAAGETISYAVSNYQAGVMYRVAYDSVAAPSKITLPTTSVIHVASLGIYDAPYPGGSLVTVPVAGSTLYVRAAVTDPFGSYDITGLDLAIAAPNPSANLNVALSDANVVTSDSGSKTYERVWQTGPVTGGYSIVATAHEGSEGITDTAVTGLSLIFLDLGTPGSVAFTSGVNGAATNGFGSGATLCFRVNDLNRNTNSTTLDTLTVSVTASSGDSEVVTLTETAADTGVFAGSLPSSVSGGGGADNGLLDAPVGSVLTVSYVDPSDSADCTTATATIVPDPGIAGVAVNATVVSPAGSQVRLGQALTLNFRIINTGSTTLTNLSVADQFPAGLLGYQSASIAPSGIAAGTLTWTNFGIMTPGQSVNFTVTFSTLASGLTTNSATVSAGSATGFTDITMLVAHPAIEVAVELLSPTNTPVAMGSNVVFHVTIHNAGNTVIPVLPVEDSFSGACFEFVSATVAPNGTGSGTLLWTNLAGSTPLPTNGVITLDATMKVVGAGNPAKNTIDVNFASDVFGNAVPEVSSTLEITTAAGQISGHVYDDKDQSGDFSAGELPLAGVGLQLFTDPNGDGNPGDGALAQATTTDANGYYELLNLNLGSYVVVEGDLPGYSSSAPLDSRIAVTMATLEANTNNNFFDYQPSPALYSTIGGSVWSDANQDGTNDIGEIGIPNVSVDLVQDVNANAAVDSGEPVVASLATDSLGSYSFAGITPGTYVIRKTTLPGYYTTGGMQPTNRNQIGIIAMGGGTFINNDFFDHLNQAPIANGFTASCCENVPVIIAALSHDLDPDGNLLALASVNTTNGAATIVDGTNVLFCPQSNFVGSATLEYTISDGHGGTAGAMITLAITNVPPLANADNFVIHENTPTLLSPLSNDMVRTPGGTLSIIAVNPTNGTASISGTDILFTPATHFVGTAWVGYTVADNVGGTSQGLATLTVATINHPPTLNPIASIAINEGAGVQTVNLAGIASGATNETSQTISISASSDNPSLIANPIVNYTSPDSTGTLSFTAASNLFGAATISVEVRDDGGSSDGGIDAVTNEFTVTVNAVTNIWAQDGSLIVSIADAAAPAGMGFTQVNYAGVLDVQATATNPFTLHLKSLDGVSSGRAANFDRDDTNTWTIATTTRGVNGFEPGTFLIDDGSFSNDLAGGRFTVEMSADSLSVNLVFLPNHAPVATPASVGRAWGTFLCIPVTNFVNGFTSDPDGDGLALAFVGASTNGSWISSDARFVYFAPTNNFVESLRYVVRDTRTYRPGDTVLTGTNWLTVMVTNAVGSAQTILVTGPSVRIRFAGVPGYAYDVERTTNIVNGTWMLLQTTNAPARGVWEYVDTEPPVPSAFYRIKQH